MRTVRIADIASSFARVADPAWADPLDATFAARPPGQRWNPAGVECLYLNTDVATAKANVARMFVGLPYGPADLDPVTAPVLVQVAVPPGQVADAYTSTGLRGVGLPASYPVDADAAPIEHPSCQRVGRRAFDAGLDGVDARSAVAGGDRELAWFPRGRTAELLERQVFDAWW